MLCSHKVIDQAIDQKVFTFTPPPGSQQIKKIGTPTRQPGETYAIPYDIPPKPKLKPPDKLKLPKVLGKEKKVVFVLDCSPSMNLSVGIPELIGAIKSLPKDCLFNIVRFGIKIKSWKDQLTPATQASKYFASRWVADQSGGGFSTIIGGLEMALTYKPEVVYVITDGKCIFPGKMTTEFPADKITARVHWVYADIPPARPGFVKILKDLAKRTEGEFIPLIAVDE